MERRRFLQASLAALGGAALPVGCGGASAAWPLPVRPGIQLYTVRAALADDLEGTLDRLAAIGYREVETHSYFGRTPAQMRGALDRAGLEAPAAHYSAAALRDDLPAAVDAAVAIGHRYVICPHPGVLPHATLDDYRAMADVLNEIGAALHAHGIRFG
jgi:hypothetical protein